MVSTFPHILFVAVQNICPKNQSSRKIFNTIYACLPPLQSFTRLLAQIFCTHSCTTNHSFCLHRKKQISSVSCDFIFSDSFLRYQTFSTTIAKRYQTFYSLLIAAVLQCNPPYPLVISFKSALNTSKPLFCNSPVNRFPSANDRIILFLPRFNKFGA